jgi:hypothetical protein
MAEMPHFHGHQQGFAPAGLGAMIPRRFEPRMEAGPQLRTREDPRTLMEREWRRKI